MPESYTVSGMSIPKPQEKITVAGRPISSLSGTTLQSAGTAIGSAARRMGQAAINQAAGRATSFVNGKIQQGIDNALSYLPQNLQNALFGGEHEDFNHLRQINKQLVHTSFVYDWNFKLEIDGAPTDIDFYVKDLSMSLHDVATDDERYGIANQTWPNSENCITLSLTLRENTDARMYNFFMNWHVLVSPGGGVVGLPVDYVRHIRVYNIATDGTETLYRSFSGYPTQVGEMSRSRENGQFMELPVTLRQFSTLGGV